MRIEWSVSGADKRRAVLQGWLDELLPFIDGLPEWIGRLMKWYAEWLTMLHNLFLLYRLNFYAYSVN